MMREGATALRFLILSLLLALPLALVIQRELSEVPAVKLSSDEACRHASKWWIVWRKEDRALCEGENLKDARWEGLSASRSWLWNEERTDEYTKEAAMRLSELKIVEANRAKWVRVMGYPAPSLFFAGWVFSFGFYLWRRTFSSASQPPRRAMALLGALFFASWILALLRLGH